MHLFLFLTEKHNDILASKGPFSDSNVLMRKI